MKFRTIQLLPLCLALSATTLARAQQHGEEGGGSSGGLGGTRLGLDLDYVNTIDEPGVGSGMGGALRIGREFDLLVVSLTPEVMGSFHRFSGASEFGGLGGGRLVIGKGIEPGLFGHVGVGHLDPAGEGMTGVAFDLGVTLDLTLLPLIDLGIHAAWDSLVVADRDAFDWYRLGAHIVFAP